MKVRVIRFRSLVDNTFEFTPSTITLLKGKSGRGKSTLYEAIRWCFYGSMRNIYPFGSEGSSSNPTVVIIELPSEGLILQRSQPPEQLTIKVQATGTVISGKQADAYIKTMFGSLQSWITSSYVPQGVICPLMTLPNVEKMALLREMVFGIEDAGSEGTPDWYLAKIDVEQDKVRTELQKIQVEYSVGHRQYGEQLPSVEQARKHWLVDQVFTHPTIVNMSILHGQVTQDTTKLIELRENLLMAREIRGKRQALLDSIGLITSNSTVNESDIRDIERQIAEQLNSISNNRELLEQEVVLCSKRKTLESALPHAVRIDSIDNLEDQTPYITQLEGNLERAQVKYRDAVQTTIMRDSLISKLENKQHQTLSPELLNLREEELRESIAKIPRLQSEIKELKDYNFRRTRYLEEKTQLEINISTILDEISRLSSIDKLEETVKACEQIIRIKDHETVRPVEGRSLTKEQRELFETAAIQLRHLDKVCKEEQVSIESVQDTITLIEQVLDSQLVIPKILRYQQLHSKIKESQKQQAQQNTVFKSHYQTDASLDNIRTIKSEIQLRIGKSLNCPGCGIDLELQGAKLQPCSKKMSPGRGQQVLEWLSQFEALFEQINMDITQLTELSRDSVFQKSIPTFGPSSIFPDGIPPLTILSDEKCAQLKITLSKLRSIVIPSSDEVKDLSLKHIEDLLELDNQAQKYQVWWSDHQTLTPNVLNIEGDPSQVKQECLDNLKRLYELQSNHKHLSSRLEQLNKQHVEKFYEHTVEQLNITLEETEQRILNLRELIEVVKLSNQLQQLSVPCTPARILTEIKDLEENISNLKEQHRVINIIKRLKELPAGIDIDHLRSLINQGESHLSELKDKLRISNVILQINQLTQTQDPDILEEQTRKLETDIQTNSAKYSSGLVVIKFENEVERLTKMKEQYMSLSQREGALTRIKSLIGETINSTLQERVDIINGSTNQIIRELFDDDISVELKLTKELKTGKGIRPQVNLVVRHKGHIYDNVSHLSGGERDRLGLALTLALSRSGTSPILLLDECIASLDAETRETCTKAIKRFAGHKTVIVSCHEVVEGFFDLTHSM